MKRLTLLASVLLTISATSVQAQSVICEKFGAGQIIANRVCPLGYVKKGEVGSNSNRGGRSSAFYSIYYHSGLFVAYVENREMKRIWGG
jgi:hypothetical protein